MDGATPPGGTGGDPTTDSNLNLDIGPGADPWVGLAELEVMANRAGLVIERLRDRVFAPGHAKQLDVRFSVRQAAGMVGRTDKAIREAEAQGRLTSPAKNPETGRHIGYTLAQINEVRRVFGTLPHRADGAGLPSGAEGLSRLRH